ncbi:MAG: hypothetical protein R2876_07775 [Eubacteriales bacterium]
MKKILYVCLTIVFCVMLFSACAGENNESASQTQTDNVSTTSPSASLNEGEGQTDSSIIAKSSNTVSDKEKEEILNDLSSELDSALDNVNDLQDLNDSDLDVDDID